MIGILRQAAMATVFLVLGAVATSACGSDDNDGADGSLGGNAGEPSSGGSSTGGRSSDGGATGGGTSSAAGAGGTAESCGNGELDQNEECDPTVNGCCAEDCSGPAESGKVCRESSDGCEPEEVCDGASVDCPKDRDACQPEVPGDWSCAGAAYGDGTCDCGCGVQDVDCPDGLIDSCEQNGCAPAAPSVSDTTTCAAPPPPGWICGAIAFVDEVCDCGCGLVDPACEDGSKESCDSSHCALGLSVGETRNDRCEGVPWTCSESSYDDQVCDCGCGAKDPDCATVDPVCESSTCLSPATPDENDSGICTEGWVCDDAYFGDGACDCGCGAFDPDCRSPSALDCEYSSCPEGQHPLPSNNSSCKEPSETPPSGWNCSPLAYSDGVCDCGCGITDADCDGDSATSCQRVNCGLAPLGQEPTECQVFPNRWFCDELAYYDDVCDCGCGTLDPACASDARSACDTSACGDGGAPLDGDNGRCEAVPSGWQCAQELFGDGACSCGCGAQDSDCATLESSSCEEEICGDEGIVSDNNATCETVPAEWTCLPQLYYDPACDCGCGAADPACQGELHCDRSGCVPPQVVGDAQGASCVDP